MGGDLKVSNDGSGHTSSKPMHNLPSIINQTDVAFPNKSRPLPPSQSSSTIRFKTRNHHHHRSLQHLRKGGTFVYSSRNCRSVKKLRQDTFTVVPPDAEHHVKDALSSGSARLTTEDHFNVLYGKPTSALSGRDHIVIPQHLPPNPITKIKLEDKMRASCSRWREQTCTPTLHLPQPSPQGKKEASQATMDSILREQIATFGDEQKQQAIGVRSYIHYLETQQKRLGLVGSSEHITALAEGQRADRGVPKNKATDSIDLLRTHIKVVENRRRKLSEAKRIAATSETVLQSKKTFVDENIIPRELLQTNRSQITRAGETTYRSRLILPRCHPATDVTNHHGYLMDLDIPALMTETHLSRQKIFNLWFQFKALCSMSSTPEGLDKPTFCSGIIASIVVEGPEVVDRQFSIHESSAGVVHFLGWVNAINALSKPKDSD